MTFNKINSDFNVHAFSSMIVLLTFSGGKDRPMVTFRPPGAVCRNKITIVTHAVTR